MKRLLILCLLTGCNFAPRYHRPCVETPQEWRTEADDSSTLCNARWWECLDDPILDALVQTALCNNKDLQVAIWRVCEFAARYQIDSSLLYPQVNLDGSALKQRFPVQASFLPEGFNPITPHYNFAFTLDYELDFWGKVRNTSYAGYSELLASIEARRTVVLTLVSNVAEAYVRLRELDRELEIAYDTLEARREYVRYATLRFEGGLTSKIEVEQAQSVYDETQAVVTLLNQLIPQQENLISILIGEPPTCIKRGRSVAQFHLVSEVPAGLPSELLCRRPDIIRAEKQLMAANARIGVARALFLPQFSLTTLFGQESFQLKNLFTAPSTAWQYGAEFMQALFTGGRLTGQLKLSVADKQARVFEYEQTVLNAFKEVDDALIAHQQARELVNVEEDRVRANNEYLRLAWLRYYNGQTEYVTILDAERQLFLAQTDLARAQGDVFITLTELYKSLGGGWVLDADECLRSDAQCQ